METYACAYCLAEITSKRKPLYIFESLCNDCISSIEEYELTLKSNTAISPNSSLGETHDHETHFSHNPLYKTQSE